MILSVIVSPVDPRNEALPRSVVGVEVKEIRMYRAPENRKRQIRGVDVTLSLPNFILSDGNGRRKEKA
jgi:hypothetical protein